MNLNRPAEYLVSLVHELQQLPNETEHVEFKENKADPHEIGEYISALANSAALASKSAGYLVWGVHDGSHEIVGTEFCPRVTKIGNEQLENWLLKLLNPKVNFQFHEIHIAEKQVVILEIEAAAGQPVQFQGNEFIRIGSYKKRLREFPERERALWRLFDIIPFERRIAREYIDDLTVLQLLDYPAYFDLVKRPLPTNHRGILSTLKEERLITRSDAGGWDITNLGALLFAKRLDEFSGLARKAPRVIIYRENSRIDTIREQIGIRGYASGFEGLIQFICGLLPSKEIIESGIRKTISMYPEIAIRELVANALIHQDLFMTGTGPMIEIFSDRVEITNPGHPLIETDRFLDLPPQSRNEQLASLMRRMGVCEERGSGVDKVIFSTEAFQLPAPVFEVSDGATRTVLFIHRPLTKMDKQDRVRACYLHASLKYVNREFLTNASLRDRFGIEARNSAIASRLIKEALDAGVIAPADEEASRKFMRYIPW